MIIDALIWHGIVKKLTSDEMFQNPTGENKTTSLEFMNYVDSNQNTKYFLQPYLHFIFMNQIYTILWSYIY